MKKSVRILAAVLLTGILFSACGDNSLMDPTSSETARVNFSVVVAASTTKAQAGTKATVNIGTLVTSGVIRLARGSMVKYVTLSISNGYASASVPNLLVGNWHADVQLYDKDGIIIYSGSADFTIYNGATTQNIELVLTRHEGTALFNFELPTETTEGPILWNKLDDLSSAVSGEYGSGLIVNGSPSFLPGKWGNGVDCGIGTSRDNSLRVPGNTIPMSDFTVEFWYTKTSEFTANQIAALVYTSNPNINFTNSMSVQIRSDWTIPGQATRYVIMFGVRINTANDLLVNHYYDFGSLDALNAAFPLNTPVHIAVSKRNSDGRLRIFMNGNLIQGSYADYTYVQHFITSDTTVIANKTGNFPYEMWIGHGNSETTDTPAGGIIDNIKIYGGEVEDFFTSFE